MRSSRLEERYCPACKRDETVEVTYDVEHLLGGEVDRTPIRAVCRLGMNSRFEAGGGRCARLSDTAKADAETPKATWAVAPVTWLHADSRVPVITPTSDRSRS
jgi:hypothetical protein